MRARGSLPVSTEHQPVVGGQGADVGERRHEGGAVADLAQVTRERERVDVEALAAPETVGQFQDVGHGAMYSLRSHLASRETQP